MKTTIKKLMFCALALIAVGAAKVSAATETYDFTGFSDNTITTAGTESKGTVNSQSINLLQIGTETFNNRFAVSRVGEERDKAWVAKNYNDEKGLYTIWNNRYFTILNLNDGDQITITWSTDGDGTLKFFDTPAIAGKSASDAVESGTTYTISTSETSVNVNLFADGTGNNTKLYIKSVVIKTPIASETVAIGQTLQTYNLEAVAKTTDITAVDPITADGTVYSRFSTQQKDNCFQISGSGWGFQVNWNKWFSINNLKAGDKVWIRYTTQNGQTVNFDDATLVGETGPVELVSETWYTLAKAADKLKLVNQVNNNGSKANYKEVKIMSIDAAVTAGTLVSNTALDFTGTSVSAYYASAANAGTVTFTQINKVAAGTPIYIKAASAGIYEIPALSDAPDETTGNLLKGSATNTTSLQSTGDTKYYELGTLSGETGFYPVSTSKTLTSAAGKAYLQLTAAQAAAAAARISMVFNDGSETTGITTADVSTQAEDNAWYTLQGVRVAQPTRGIYVRNGKKIIIK